MKSYEVDHDGRRWRVDFNGSGLAGLYVFDPSCEMFRFVGVMRHDVRGIFRYGDNDKIFKPIAKQVNSMRYMEEVMRM